MPIPVDPSLPVIFSVSAKDELGLVKVAFLASADGSVGLLN